MRKWEKTIFSRFFIHFGKTNGNQTRNSWVGFHKTVTHSSHHVWAKNRKVSWKLSQVKIELSWFHKNMEVSPRFSENYLNTPCLFNYPFSNAPLLEFGLFNVRIKVKSIRHVIMAKFSWIDDRSRQPSRWIWMSFPEGSGGDEFPNLAEFVIP